MFTTRGNSNVSRWHTGWLFTDCPHRLQTECFVGGTIKGGSWHLLGRIRHFPIPNECNGKSCLAFTYRGRQYSYNRLPQGFILSPGIFNQVLKEQLMKCTLPPDCVLIMYVDDLLLAATTNEGCLQATDLILQQLYASGFKVSKEKLQVSRPSVAFMGRLITAQGSTLSPSQRNSILSHPKPVTVKDMLSFLGLTGFSRNYIPMYVALTTPLRQLVKEPGVKNLQADVIKSQFNMELLFQLKELVIKYIICSIKPY